MMFIITSMVNGEKYYFDGCYFTMSAEFAELYTDAFDAILEMCALATQIDSSFRKLKVEEI